MNLTIFKYDNLEVLWKALDDVRISPTFEEHDLYKSGLSPTHKTTDNLVTDLGTVKVLCFTQRSRVLSPAVVTKAVEDRVQHITATTGIIPMGAEIKSIKADIKETLIYTMPPQDKRTYIAFTDNYIVVSTTSPSTLASIEGLLDKIVAANEYRRIYLSPEAVHQFALSIPAANFSQESLVELSDSNGTRVVYAGQLDDELPQSQLQAGRCVSALRVSNGICLMDVRPFVVQNVKLLPTVTADYADVWRESAETVEALSFAALAVGMLGDYTKAIALYGSR